MNYLQIWLGSEVTKSVQISINSLKDTMLEGDTYSLITDFTEADEFMNDWWKSCLNAANNDYEKWATYSEILRINYAIKDPDLLYADTDVLLYGKPNPVYEDIPLLADDLNGFRGYWPSKGMTCLHLFYVNDACWWFEELLSKMYSLKAEFAAYHLALCEVVKPASIPFTTYKHKFGKHYDIDI